MKKTFTERLSQLKGERWDTNMSIKSIWKVYYVVDRGNFEFMKIVGVFTSRSEAKRVIARYRRLPGFSKKIGRFWNQPETIGEDSWTSGFVTVGGRRTSADCQKWKMPKQTDGKGRKAGTQIFSVYHTYCNCGYDETKFIGNYLSLAQARAAISRLRKKAGFRRYPKNFVVETYSVGQCYWRNGFKSVRLPKSVQSKIIDKKFLNSRKRA